MKDDIKRFGQVVERQKRDLEITDPDHYAGGPSGYEHQYWDVAYEQWGPSALLAQAMKYIMRAGKKPGEPMLQDVRKAINYLVHLARKLEEAEKSRGNP
jgi:hypothetical protein